MELQALKLKLDPIQHVLLFLQLLSSHCLLFVLYMFSFKIGYVWTRLICSDHQEQSNKCDGTYRCVMFILYSIHIHIVMYPPLQIQFLTAKTSNGSEVHP